MINLLIDVNLSAKWINFLEDNELNCTHWLAIGNCDDSDEDKVRLLPI